jgi:hypothetical protein
VQFGEQIISASRGATTLRKEKDMSEPHEVRETKDYSKIPTKELTGQDIAIILLELMLEHRAVLRGYELYALEYASALVHTPVNGRKAKHILDAQLEVQDYMREKGEL